MSLFPAPGRLFVVMFNGFFVFFLITGSKRGRKDSTDRETYPISEEREHSVVTGSSSLKDRHKRWSTSDKMTKKLN